jgi:hypothetical protein
MLPCNLPQLLLIGIGCVVLGMSNHGIPLIYLSKEVKLFDESLTPKQVSDLVSSHLRGSRRRIYSQGESPAVPSKIPRLEILSVFCAKPAHEKNDKAYQQNQANPSAADDGAAKVKSATAEQEKENDQD